MGITIGGVSHQRPGTNYDIWFDFLEGGPSDATYEVRGDDRIIPAKPGRLVRDRQPDKLSIVLVGWVEGQGATDTLRRQDYFDLMAELLTVWDGAIAPVTITVSSPTEGVPSTMSIDARFVRKSGPAKVGEHFRRFTIYFESVDSPPVWS